MNKSAPKFYATSLNDIEENLAEIRAGEIRKIGYSAGGKPIYSISYGDKEPINRTANLSSALAAKRPEAFFGTEKRKKQVILIIAAVHGGEMEGIAATLNLISVMEKGVDLKRNDWTKLRKMAEKTRLVIVPCLNVDGRGRIPSDDPKKWTDYEREKYRHGLYPDGSPIGWPQCKVPHPRDPKQHAFLGGYFNDKGVNPLHGVFLSEEIAPETHIALRLALEETPDFVLDLHSCGAGPFFIVGDKALPESFNRRQYYIDGFCRQILSERLNIHRPWTVEGQEYVLTLDSAFYHVCGALPMIFEGPDGAQPNNIYGYEEIIDIYLTIIEGLISIGIKEGFKPPVPWST